MGRRVAIWISRFFRLKIDLHTSRDQLVILYFVPNILLKVSTIVFRSRDPSPATPSRLVMIPNIYFKVSFLSNPSEWPFVSLTIFWFSVWAKIILNGFVRWKILCTVSYQCISLLTVNHFSLIDRFTIRWINLTIFNCDLRCWHKIIKTIAISSIDPKAL